MKNGIFFLINLLIVINLGFSQDITGQWNGVLEVDGTQLRIIFHIEDKGDEYSATMDSPDQKAEGIPMTEVIYKHPTIILSLEEAQIEYKGKLNDEGIIVGTFKQGKLKYPMNLSREIVAPKILTKPQDPVEPYPYYSEEVTFENKEDSVTLSGTLTHPTKDWASYPVVILISGSGPQNRDEELMGHRPFLVLSDYLTRNGIGVLRFDDRGVGKSTGNFATATTDDFSNDVESAVDYLLTRKDFNSNQIGLIGHSEGGIIAPMVAARRTEVSYIVLLAGTGIRGKELLLLQMELIAKADGASEKELNESKELNTKIYDIILNSPNHETMVTDLKIIISKIVKQTPKSQKPNGVSDEVFTEQMVASITSPWLVNFIKYDPSLVLKDVKCPVLALNGDKDLQVPSKINLAAIEAGLKSGGNENVTVKELPGLNHLFQECTTGSPTEYANIEQTMSPVALNEISTWILSVLKQ